MVPCMQRTPFPVPADYGQDCVRSTRWTFLFLCLLAVSCKKGPRLRGVPKPESALPTTRADIYLANMDAEIEELTRVTRGKTSVTPDLLLLSATHHTRGRYRGDLDEIQLGIDGLDRCVVMEPDNATCWLMRAEQEQSLHRFAPSRSDLEKAKSLGVPPPKTAGLEADLDWNAGRYDVAIPAIRRLRIAKPSTGTWIREAQLDHELGLEDDADRAYEAAEDAITDTGPLVVAHLDIQRGMQKMQTGKLDEAIVFFRAAVARMPDHVAALEHLAETLHMQGKDAEATTLYEKVVHLTDDPEFAHALGELYALHGRPEEARALKERAAQGYATLLAKYPEAMYWHASEFYMAVGDAPRAAALLEKNVALRPNSTSYVALARAQLASHQDAHAAIDKALAMPPVSALLFWTAAQVYAGDARAAGWRARASKMNPRIAQEP